MSGKLIFQVEWMNQINHGIQSVEKNHFPLHFQTSWKNFFQPHAERSTFRCVFRWVDRALFHKEKMINFPRQFQTDWKKFFQAHAERSTFHRVFRWVESWSFRCGWKKFFQLVWKVSGKFIFPADWKPWLNCFIPLHLKGELSAHLKSPRKAYI
jgi:hypothetical protein